MENVQNVQESIRAWSEANAQQINFRQRLAFFLRITGQTYPQEERIVDILPINKMEERLDLARKYYRLQQLGSDIPWQLATSHYVGFFILPLQTLRDRTGSLVAAYDLEHKLDDLLTITRQCKY